MLRNMAESANSIFLYHATISAPANNETVGKTAGVVRRMIDIPRTLKDAANRLNSAAFVLSLLIWSSANRAMIKIRTPARKPIALYNEAMMVNRMQAPTAIGQKEW